MIKNKQNHRPTLIVVTGQPGSGKTTLAHRLAQTIRCPAICRDEIKEGLVHTTGLRGKSADALGSPVYATFFDTINLLLRNEITLIVEAAFQHKLWAPKLEPLREIADLRIILCTVEPELARWRRMERAKDDPNRLLFHHDPSAEAGSELPISEYDPPHLDVPILMVDTTDGYLPAFENIVSFAASKI